MQNITTVQTEDQDTKHNSSTNRRSAYKTQQHYKQTFRIENITTLQTEDQETKHKKQY